MRIPIFVLLLMLPLFGAAQKIKFEEKVKKFEKVEVGPTLSFDFFYVNDGDQPLLIEDIKVSCSCTKFTYSQTPLMPGEKDVIKVTFDTKGKWGYQDRILEVYTNDPKSPAKIRFRGTVDNPDH